MFDYPLKIETISPRHLWIRASSGERVAGADGGTPREPGIIRVRSIEGGRAGAEILRVVDAAAGAGIPLGTPEGGAVPPGERFSAERLRRFYGGPGVPRGEARPPDYYVSAAETGHLGSLSVETGRGIWTIADAGEGEVGRFVRQSMFFRDGDVEFGGQVAMRLRRRSLLFGGMELAKPGGVEISADTEKLLVACVVVVLLAGSSGEG